VTDEGGDPACWLDRVCERCGAFVEDGRSHECPPRVDAVPEPGEPRD
jgi:hypothetical protein